MTRKLIVPILIILQSLLNFGCESSFNTFQRSAYRQTVMGCEGIIVLPGYRNNLMDNAVKKAFARAIKLENSISDWLLNSEINQILLCPGVEHPISADLAEVIRYSKIWNLETHGAFDPTVGGLTSFWREVRMFGMYPLGQDFNMLKESVGFEQIKFNDGVQPTLSFASDKVKLDFGAIGKGFAADLACQILREEGFPSALVSIGGDLVVSDAPPGHNGWRIQFRFPGKKILPNKEWSNVGIAVSGDSEQIFEFNGEEYSHFIDIYSSKPILRGSSVAVANTGALADIVATCALLVTSEISKEWLNKYSDLIFLHTVR